ncbi:MAG TPA: hypothetical protein VGC79_37205 [Polyangiaceae bacterium]
MSKLSTDPAHRDWLTVQAQALECTVLIGGIPIKFYRGEPTDPTPRALRGGVTAARRNGLAQALRDRKRGQATMFELFGQQPKDDGSWFWLFAIETHEDGTMSRAVLLQATEDGDVRNDWDVPLDPSAPALADVTSMQREGVDLLPPPVGPKTVELPAASTVAGHVDGES